MASATSKEQTNSDECSTLPERCTEEVLSVSTTSKMVVVTQKMIKLNDMQTHVQLVTGSFFYSYSHFCNSELV